jgi:Polyketide cyclase / dehydrase and lipid transport
MRWILIAGAVLLALAALALVVGWMLPVAHVASKQATFAVPPETVWAAITNIEAFPSWRSDLTKVERRPDLDGRPVWVEEGRSGRLTLAVERSERPRTLVTRIADRELPFGGTWVYEIAPGPGGCTLTITEHGEIYNPIFRVMARLVFGYEGTLSAYLKSLRKKLAE